jgi:hypothetical protein
MPHRFIVVSQARAIELGVDDAADYCDADRCFLLDTASTPPRLVAADGGEPEDQSFGRDLSWVVSELNAVAEGR